MDTFEEIVEGISLNEEERKALIEAIKFNNAAAPESFNRMIEMNLPGGCRHGKCCL